MEDHDLAGADLRGHAQPSQRDRDGVAVLADGDERLRVDTDCRGLRRVERLAGQRAQHRALPRELLSDRPGPPVDPPVKIGLAAGEQQPVERGDRPDRRDRDEVVAAVAPDLALNAALLMRPRDSRGREDRVEQVVRAQRDEPIRLDPPAAAQHLLHRRAEIVIAHLGEHASEPRERERVTLQKRLLRLDRAGHAERRAREARPHEKQMHPGQRPRQVDVRLTPVNLGRHPRRVACGTNTSPAAKPSSRRRLRT